MYVWSTWHLKQGNKAVSLALHDFVEAFFAFSICTHTSRCDLIYALKKNTVFPVLMFTEFTNVRTGSSAGLNKFLCRFEQVHVRV